MDAVVPSLVESWLHSLVHPIDIGVWHPPPVPDAPPVPAGAPAGSSGEEDSRDEGDDDGGAAGGDAHERRCRALLLEVESQQRVIAAGAAAQARALAAWTAVVADPGAGVGDAHDGWRAALAADAIEVVADEASAALGLTPGSAVRLVHAATWLVDALPETLRALEVGVLDWRRAAQIAAATAHLDREVAAEVDEALCGPGGAGLEVVGRRLLRAIDVAIHAADASGVVRRSRQRTADRGVRTRALTDGQGELVVTGPAPAIAGMAAALDVLGEEGRARSREGQGSGDPYALPGVDGDSGACAGAEHDHRGIDAHRFDALHELLSTAPRAAAAGKRGAPTVMVTLPTLLGEDDEPGHLPGFGAVPAWLARQAASCSRLHRVLTDPFTGAVTAVDGHSYPPGWLTDAPRGSHGPGPAGGPGPSDDPGPPGGGRRPGGEGPGSPPGGGAGGAAAETPHEGTARAAISTARASTCAPVDLSACPTARRGGGPYRPSVGLARLVAAAWGTCTAPHCSRPATRCDLDHVVAHPTGPTCLCDLHPLCRRHHLMKHGTAHPDAARRGSNPTRADWASSAGSRRLRWHTFRCRSGHQHWTSPLGRRYTTTAWSVLPPRRASRDVVRVPIPPLSYLESITRTATTRVRGATATAPAPEEPLRSGYDGLDPLRPQF